MNTYEYKGRSCTVKELSELSGVSPPTIRDRLRRGYNVEQAIRVIPTNESVEHFCESSWYEDWIGMSTSYLYKIYWKWCISHEYTPLQAKAFTRQIMALYPNLKTVPTRKKDGCYRVIREK